MQKAISMFAGAGKKTKLIVGKGDPREREKLEPVPVTAMQIGPTKRPGQGHKSQRTAGQKLGWGWRDCCMVI